MSTVTIARPKMAERVSYIGLLGICIVLFLAVLFLLDRGIDLTDEGAYLNSIATPALYPASLSLYGFFYHPLLTAFSYDIALLRAFNYAALVFLTLLLVIRTTYATGISRSPDRLARIALWAAYTTCALFFYCIWLPTPSYNSLNVCGALLLAYAAIGMVVSERFSVRETVIAGVALSLCALAKPSSGAALAVLLLISAFRARRGYLRSIFAAGLLSAILCCAFLLAVRGSPGAALQSFHESVLLANGLLSGKSTFDSYLGDSFPYLTEYHYAFLVCAIATIIFITTEFRDRFESWAIPLQFAAFSALLALCIWERFRVDSWNRPLHWTPVLFAIALALCNVARTKVIHIRHLRVALILLAIPFAVGIGSNTGMSRSAGQAAAVWSAASLFILAIAFDGETLRTYAAKIAIACVIAVAVVITWAIYLPQRQAAPLWAQQTWISAHGQARTLRVDAGTAAYFRKLDSAAQANGFSDETGVIDLTGNAAVTIYVLGGKALGSPYFSGGNSWTEWIVERLLRPISSERLERAWVITRVPAVDTINPTILRRLGLDFPNGYKPIARAVAPTATGEQTLWKPNSLDGSIRSSAPE